MKPKTSKKKAPSPVEPCDGSCMEEFLKALRDHFGKEAELPTSFVMSGNKLMTVISGPIILIPKEKGRGKRRVSLMLPFCGVCGKPNTSGETKAKAG